MTRKVLVAHCVGPTLRLHDEYRTEEARDADGKMVGIVSLKMFFLLVSINALFSGGCSMHKNEGK